MKDKFGCAPIGKIIFTNSEKEKEWDEMDPNVKAFVMKNLYESAKKMESEIAIEMLCHVINDLIKRIEVLENARNRRSPCMGGGFAGGGKPNEGGHEI